MPKQVDSPMAKTAVACARTDGDVKEKAESVLKELGISVSGAVLMLRSQAARCKFLSLWLELSAPLFFEGDHSEEELRKKIEEAAEGLKTL